MSIGIRILAVSGALVAGVSSVAKAPSDAGYPYHIADTVVGTMLPKNIVTSPLPFDSSYAELTPEQKAVLFDDYEHLSPGDEPPFPMYGIHHVVQPLIPYAETFNPIGRLVAAVEVDSKGQATSVTVFQSPDSRFSNLMSAALMFEQYKPASCQGTPCRMQFVLHLDFPDRRALPITNIELQNNDPHMANLFHH